MVLSNVIVDITISSRSFVFSQSDVQISAGLTNISGLAVAVSDDDFRSGCRNVSQCHLKQSFSVLHSPGRSQFTELYYYYYYYYYCCCCCCCCWKKTIYTTYNSNLKTILILIIAKNISQASLYVQRWKIKNKHFFKLAKTMRVRITLKVKC